MTEPFVLHFCTFIPATGGSAAPRFLFFPFFFVGGLFLLLLLLCFATPACFVTLAMRGKSSALCRSADKSFLLVTYCLTETHTCTHTHNKLPESAGLAVSQLKGCLTGPNLQQKRESN